MYLSLSLKLFVLKKSSQQRLIMFLTMLPPLVGVMGVTGPLSAGTGGSRAVGRHLKMFLRIKLYVSLQIWVLEAGDSSRHRLQIGLQLCSNRYFAAMTGADWLMVCAVYNLNSLARQIAKSMYFVNCLFNDCCVKNVGKSRNSSDGNSFHLCLDS